MRFKVLLAALALVVVAPLFSAETKIKMAVKRGQVSVDASLMPLACLTLVLDHATMPLSRVVLRNRATHDVIIAAVGSQDPTHPNVLTAMQGAHRSLIMVILHLDPGFYDLRSVEFEGRKRSYFRMALDKGGTCSFEVKPACVNCVGSVVISAEWEKFATGQTVVPLKVEVEQSQGRDWKWAVDVVPGLAKLPPGASRIEMN